MRRALQPCSTGSLISLGRNTCIKHHHARAPGFSLMQRRRYQVSKTPLTRITGHIDWD
jgi:hypothetical protein